MKKRFIIVALGLALSLSLVACKKGDIEPEDSYIGNKYIDLVTIYKDDAWNTEVFYDRNTKVMYFSKNSSYTFGITPIYNSDGTVKLYDGE